MKSYKEIYDGYVEVMTEFRISQKISYEYKTNMLVSPDDFINQPEDMYPYLAICLPWCIQYLPQTELLCMMACYSDHDAVMYIENVTPEIEREIKKVKLFYPYTRD